MINIQEEVTKLFHFNNRTLVDSQRPFPVINNLNDLSKPSVIEQFDKLIQIIIDKDDGETALLARHVLEDVVLAQYPKLAIENPVVYFTYKRFIDLMKIINLSIRGLDDMSRLIQEDFVIAVERNINIALKFQDVLDAYDDLFMDGQIAKQLSDALLANHEKIGDFLLLEIEDKPQPPTLANWLKDYIIYGMSGPEKNTGSIQRIEYFNKNINGKKLGKSNKNLVNLIFKIYDWLRFGGDIPSISEIFPEKKGILDEIYNDYIYYFSRRYGTEEDIENKGYVFQEKFKFSEDRQEEKQIVLKQPPVVPVKPPEKNQESRIKYQELGSKNDAITSPNPSFARRGMDADDNKKAAQLRAIPETQPMAERPALTSVDSMAVSQNLSKNILPKKEPILPQEELTSINIHDILNRRQTETDGHSGLKLGDGQLVAPLRPILRDASEGRQDFGGQASIKSQELRIKNSDISNQTVSSTNNNNTEKPRVDIDKKLEELKKKVNK